MPALAQRWTNVATKSLGLALNRNTRCWTRQPVGQQDSLLEAFLPQRALLLRVGAVSAEENWSEQHTTWCIEAGLAISGTNAEVMPGQWEFQIGPADTVTVGDHLWMARYLLYRAGELHGLEISIDAKPMKGTGTERVCIPTSQPMRYLATTQSKSCSSRWVHLGNRKNTSAGYGVGIEDRLTGEHETQRL